jgi:predicted metalloprotease with PDZ domain
MPYDYSREQYTRELWFAEGFTNYYGPLAILRARLSSIDEYLQGTSGALNYVFNTPGRTYGSPMEMSLRAPFVDAATSIDPVNPNIFTSYYTYGQVLALALDLQLRGRPGGKTLDDYMRLMWRTHGVPEKPYTTADLERALATLTGDAAFADRFFTQSIEGSAIPDLAPLLAQAGLTLRPANPAKAWAGQVQFETADGALQLASYPASGTPIYAAGVSKGDRIVSLNGKAIKKEADWSEAIGRHAPGDVVDIAFEQRGIERQAKLTLASDPTLEVVRNETIGKPLTPAQSAFRTAWIGAEKRP